MYLNVILRSLEVDMSEWISCEDKMPDVNFSWYLICNNGIVTMAFFEKDGDIVRWLCHNDTSNEEWDDVTHWMQLPEQPIK